jgi:hypothetical protein
MILSLKPTDLQIFRSFDWSVLLVFFSFCVVLLCVFTFRVPCCDIRYDFRMKPMFDLSLYPLVCRRAQILFAYSGVWRVSCCVIVLFFFVLCTLCCQFFWILRFWLPLRFSLERLFILFIKLILMILKHPIYSFFHWYFIFVLTSL